MNKAGARTKRTKTGGVLEGVGAMDINRLSATKDKLLLLKIFKVPLSLNMLHAQEFTAPEGGSKLFSRWSKCDTPDFQNSTTRQTDLL